MRCDPRSWKAFTKQLKKTLDENYVYHECFGKWYDSLFFIKYIIKCYFFSKKKYIFDGIDISPLIKESLMNFSGMLNTFCDYKSFDRLTRKIKINRLVIWYEARPMDNAMAMIYRRNNPEGKCIGYMGYPLSEYFLGQKITVEQQRQNACPNIMAVTGENYINEIIEFNPDVKVITAPCLRNRYYKVKRVPHDKFTILVAVSYYVEDAQLMIGIINEYCNIREDIDVRIKMHPSNIAYSIEDYYKKSLYFTPKYVSGKLLDCAIDADIVFTARSASSMEIICGGIPLICLCRPGELQETSIAKDVNTNLYSIIYNSEDFIKAVDNIKNNNKGVYRGVENINPEDFFVVPTHENVKKFLEA